MRTTKQLLANPTSEALICYYKMFGLLCLTAFLSFSLLMTTISIEENRTGEVKLEGARCLDRSFRVQLQKKHIRNYIFSQASPVRENGGSGVASEVYALIQNFSTPRPNVAYVHTLT